MVSPMPPRRPLPTVQEAAEILSRRRSRPMPRPAPPAGRALGPVLKALEEKFGQGPGQLQLKWKEIVGETLARHTEPVKLVKARGNAPGVLELRVAGPAGTLHAYRSEGRAAIEEATGYDLDGVPFVAAVLAGAKTIVGLPVPDYTKPPAMESGGGGLVSTTSDYGRFSQMILNKGEYNGVRLLGRKTVELMLTNQTKEPVQVQDQVQAQAAQSGAWLWQLVLGGVGGHQKTKPTLKCKRSFCTACP